MARDLKVDLQDVQLAADKIDVAADGLRSAHGSVHERISAAHSGWIGVSGAALSAASNHWQEESAARYSELIGHAADYRAAVTRYAATDGSKAADIDATVTAMRL